MTNLRQRVEEGNNNEGRMKDYIDELLTGIGCRKHESQYGGKKYILDGFDSEFYLIFDATLCEDKPKPGTVDIILAEPGEHPNETAFQTRVISDAGESGIKRFLYALGVHRFSERTRKYLHESNLIVRTAE
jgi:hypothetical protein